jgi:hypothetical protein
MTPLLYHLKKEPNRNLGNDLFLFLSSLGCFQVFGGLVLFAKSSETDVQSPYGNFISLLWDLLILFSQVSDLFFNVTQLASRKLFLLGYLTLQYYLLYNMVFQTTSFFVPLYFITVFVALLPKKTSLSIFIFSSLSMAAFVTLFAFQSTSDPRMIQGTPYCTNNTITVELVKECPPKECPPCVLPPPNPFGVVKVLPLRPVWIYFTGNLRDFENDTSLAGMIHNMNHPNVRVFMHTWSTFDHSFRHLAPSKSHTRRSLQRSEKNFG